MKKPEKGKLRASRPRLASADDDQVEDSRDDYVQIRVNKGPNILDPRTWSAETSRELLEVDSSDRMDDLTQKRRERARVTERWGAHGKEQMVTLCAAFPLLRGQPGTDPWSVEAFVRWVCSEPISSGALHAARFALNVWSAGTDWPVVVAHMDIKGGDVLTPFDVVRAMAVWDRAHRDAFTAWATLPFFP